MTLRDARRAHPNWFAAVTMRFFDSRIESAMFSGRFFICSEQFRSVRLGDRPREYRIVEVTSERIGSVRYVPKYPSLSKALAAVEQLTSVRHERL